MGITAPTKIIQAVIPEPQENMMGSFLLMDRFEIMAINSSLVL